VGFGRMEANIAKNHGDHKAEIKPIIWQVRVLFGGVLLVCSVYPVNRPLVRC